MIGPLKRQAFNLRQGKGEALQDLSTMWASHYEPVFQDYGGTL